MATNSTTITSPPAPNPNSHPLQTFLASNPSIEFIRFQIPSYSGLLKTIIRSTTSSLRLAKTSSAINVVHSFLAWSCSDGSLNFPAVSAEKDELVPDWTSLVVCHYEPRHASVMCGVSEPNNGFESCPRSVLRKWESEAKEKYDLDILVGAEIEFYLCTWNDGPVPISSGKNPPFSGIGFRDARCMGVLEETIRVLEKAGIETSQLHAEADAVGLFEISLEPMPPVKAVDALVYAHETLRAVAARCGLHATVHPKPFEQLSGVGAHMHLSISEGGKVADSFLAGMLKHLPAITAFGMPGFDSYDRTMMSGGEWVTWGDQNRLCPIRRITRNHWEVRCIDATANMYLVVAALICSGLGGVERGDELKIKGRDVMNVLALEVTEKERAELNITTRMPASMEQALAALKEDQEFGKEFGTNLVDKYLGNKTQELRNSASMTSVERRKTFARVF